MVLSSADAVRVIPIVTATLGNRSYIAVCDGWAVAVDVPRDIDRVERALEEAGARLALVVETHIHNDYLTGGLALARAQGVEYVVPSGPRLDYPATRPGDGSVVAAGPMSVTIADTPGHTDAHAAYVVGVRGAQGAADVFTGGSLLLGGTGRTDLLGIDRAEVLAREQYRSVRRLAGLLDADSALWPTHGFGSFCMAGAPVAGGHLLRDQVAVNPALVLSEDDFVAQALGGLGPYPAYYRRMAPLNLAGPEAADLRVPGRLVAGGLTGLTLVDVRRPDLYAAGHIEGSVHVSASGALGTWLGWVLSIDTPIAIVAADEEEAAAAVRDLRRVGFDGIRGLHVIEQDEDGALASTVRATFVELKAARAERSGIVVLDVREHAEWERGHLDGAVNAPVHTLPIADLDPLMGREVWVHCAAGYRAGLAVSILERRGIAAIWVDDSLV